jgi:tetratricopeptide (TPR) repeat protein
MGIIDLEKERWKLDRQITFFHFRRAARRINKCLRYAKKTRNIFFLYYFTAQSLILKKDLLRLRPGDGCTYNDKAICLAELSYYHRALDCFNEGLRHDRNCAALYHNKGWLLNSLGKHRQAILCFKKSLELDSERVESLYSLADSYLCLGKTGLARKYFLRSLVKLKGRCSYMYKETLKRLREMDKRG